MLSPNISKKKKKALRKSVFHTTKIESIPSFVRDFKKNESLSERKFRKQKLTINKENLMGLISSTKMCYPGYIKDLYIAITESEGSHHYRRLTFRNRL